MKVVCLIALAAVLCVSVTEAVPMGRLGVKRVECHLSYFTCDNCVGYQTEQGKRTHPCYWDFSTGACTNNVPQPSEANCAGTDKYKCEPCKPKWDAYVAAKNKQSAAQAALPASASGAKPGEADGDVACATANNLFTACTRKRTAHRIWTAYCKILANGDCVHSESDRLKKAKPAPKTWGIGDDETEWKAANAKFRPAAAPALAPAKAAAPAPAQAQKAAAPATVAPAAAVANKLASSVAAVLGPDPPKIPAAPAVPKAAAPAVPKAAAPAAAAPAPPKAAAPAPAAPAKSASGAGPGEKDGDEVCRKFKFWNACTSGKTEHAGRMGYCRMTESGECLHEKSDRLKGKKSWGLMDDQEEWMNANARWQKKNGK